jgi:peptide/nickel transport system substrate-binding protein
LDVLHTRWPVFGALVAGVTVVAAIWFLILTNPKGEAVPASGGSYTEGVLTSPERINPLFAAPNTIDQDLSSLIFSGLVRLGPDGTPQPDLAERWEITGNGQSYVFHLREGVAWQDDAQTRFDAEDVLFTYRAIADPSFKGDPALAAVMRGVVVQARDPYTIEFRLQQTYAPFLAYLTVGILPEHLLRGLDANQLFNDEFNSRPIGTGPYQLKGRSDDRVVLETNPTYYFGPPKISTVELRTFKDEGDVLAALRTGDIDGALLDPSVPDSDVTFLRDDGGFTLTQLAAASMQVLYFDTRAPMFQDARVREALLRGINKQAVINDAGGGRAATADAFIPSASWAYTQLETPEFDPTKAATLLEQAGFQRGRDGIRQKDNIRLTFDLWTSDDPLRRRIAENIAQQWQSLGVSVSVKAFPAATYLQDQVLPRGFTAALLEVDPGPDPDPYPFWHSSQIEPPGRNLSNYGTPQMDDVLERARQNTDAARRKDLYELFEGYIIADTPAVPLFAPVYIYAQRTQVQGTRPALLFTPSTRFTNINEWYVRTRVE